MTDDEKIAAIHKQLDNCPDVISVIGVLIFSAYDYGAHEGLKPDHVIEGQHLTADYLQILHDVILRRVQQKRGRSLLMDILKMEHK